MTNSQHTLHASLADHGDLSVEEGSLSFDAGREPHVRLELTIAQPANDLLAQLDPREPRRIRGYLRQDFGVAQPLSAETARFAGMPLSAETAAFGGLPLRAYTAAYYTAWNSFGVRPARVRPFDLALDERSVRHAEGRVSIVATSDESLLQGNRLMASVPYSFLTTSVRSIVTIVLARIGATLEPGLTDGTIEADSAVWQPGVSASDFLEPLTEKTGLKLKCDEQRRWTLDPLEMTQPGQVNLSTGSTVTDLEETISRTNDEWYDGVLIEYPWIDAAGATQKAYDYAPASGATKVKHIIRADVKYPGPGAAERHLRAAQGRGRQISPRAVTDPLVTPGMAALVTFPTAPPQTGFVEAVTFEVPADEMTVKTRGLIDTPPTAWVFDPPGGSWADIPAGTDWTEDA